MLELQTSIARAARVEVVVGEAGIGSEKVRLDAAWRLHRHLRPVLEDVHGELGTRHAGHPQTEVLVHL